MMYGRCVTNVFAFCIFWRLQVDRLIMLGDAVSSTCWYTRRPVISSAVDRIRTEAEGMWRQICVQVSGSRDVWAVPRSWPLGGQGASVGSWDSKITCRRATERGKVHHINTAIHFRTSCVMSCRDVIAIITVHILVLSMNKATTVFFGVIQY